MFWVSDRKVHVTIDHRITMILKKNYTSLKVCNDMQN